MKKAAVLCLLIFMLISGCIGEPQTPDAEEIACPKDLKICPDGSSVFRLPPDCEFAPCPEETVETSPPQAQATTPSSTPTPLPQTGQPQTTAPSPTTTVPPTTAAPTKTVAVSARPWMDIELKDVATGESFRIGDFNGKPVLLESFAVWCPKCLAQQQNVKKLREQESSETVHISLDTDPNEDQEKVREHIERHGFDWYYAVSPIELSNALIDDYGLVVVNAPSVPTILICEDQETRFLRTGIKKAEELEREIDAGC